MSLPSWELFDTRLEDRVLLPTGSHNPAIETGEQCMIVASHETALEITQETNLQVVIFAPLDATTPKDFEYLNASNNPAKPLELAEVIRSLGRVPLLVCNTTRSPDASTAIQRANSGYDTYGLSNIKLEVTSPRLWRTGYYRLVPIDEEVINANRRLTAQGFQTAPLLSCFLRAVSEAEAKNNARRVIEENAKAIRFCVGRVGDNSGIEDEGLLRSVIDFIREDYGESFPILAECGMTPKSIYRAIKLGATATLANHYVVSAADPVAAAKDCIRSATEGFLAR